MGIDLDSKLTARFFKKWITVSKLKDILIKLEKDDLLYPNRVGNLTVIRNEKYVGYIDFNTEEGVLFEEKDV